MRRFYSLLKSFGYCSLAVAMLAANSQAAAPVKQPPAKQPAKVTTLKPTTGSKAPVKVSPATAATPKTTLLEQAQKGPLQVFNVRPTLTSIEEMLVYRMQLKVTTANVKDANTDDSVIAYVATAGTWLDHPGDDRERGQTYTHDLNFTNQAGAQVVSKLRDINSLRITKTGTDGWCVKSVELIVNGRAIFQKTFPGSGLWLDNEGSAKLSHSISGAELRQHSLWKSYQAPQPSPVISRTELEARIEGIMGHLIHGTKAKWGKIYNGRAVEVTKKDDRTIHVDLDLEAGITGPNPEVDIDFDIEFIPMPGRLDLKLKNFKANVDSKWWAELFSFGLFEVFDRIAQKQIKGMLSERVISLTLPAGVTPVVLINPQGDIILLPKK